MNKVIIGHSTEPDPDGLKHEWLMYKYGDYIFNKEWYMNFENEYVMGLTLFKLGKQNKLVPRVNYKGKYYNEVFHSGNVKETDDDEIIKHVEMIHRRNNESGNINNRNNKENC